MTDSHRGPKARSVSTTDRIPENQPTGVKQTFGASARLVFQIGTKALGIARAFRRAIGRRGHALLAETLGSPFMGHDQRSLA